jgi:hypothetical protein
MDLLIKTLKERLKMVKSIKYTNRNNVEMVIEDLKEIPILTSLKEAEFVFDNGDTKRVNLVELKTALENDDITYFKRDEELKKIRNFIKEREIELNKVDFDFNKVYLKSYEDITDKEFNGFQEIPQAFLNTQGLWVGQGIRKIRVEFKNIEGNITRAFFNRQNNNEIEPINIEVKDNVLLIDTDLIEEQLDGIISGEFYGKMEMVKEQEKYYFPFYIKFKSPKMNGIWEKNDAVAIDFGTSSTCVAINRGKELVPFTDNVKSEEDYENPTALILFNWNHIYNGWSGYKMPHFVRSNNEENAESVNIEKEDYNYATYVKKTLKGSPSFRTIEAIVTKLKLIPYEKDKNPDVKFSVKPFDDFKNLVYLTDELEESDEMLNPIALYGYLIGRSLNLQLKDKVYTKYELTMPVKFNKTQKEKIQKSLEYGIKKAIPKSLRDEVSVEFKLEEPVALLGAAKMIKALKFPKTKKALMFAVFDFGGGTLDFAFGIYRKPDIKSKDIAILDNEKKYKDIIEIFKTDGMALGGETLIESLSYEIYKNNKELMEKNLIPIKVPAGEKSIKNFNTKLLIDTHISFVNLQKLNETISRDFFINLKFKEEDEEVEAFERELFDINGNVKKVNFKLDKKSYEDFLSKKIEEAVENFKRILKSSFEEKEERLNLLGYDGFDLNDVKIFLSGNTSKSELVQKAFKEVFKDVENLEDNLIKVEDKSKGIELKNAVARGALYLRAVGVYNHSISDDKMPLDRYIWNIEDLEEGVNEPKFMPGDNENKEFKVVARLDKNVVEIYFSDIANIEDELDDNLRRLLIEIPEEFLNDSYYLLYAKPYNDHIIEATLGDDESIDSRSFFINLDSGEIKESL